MHLKTKMGKSKLKFLIFILSITTLYAIPLASAEEPLLFGFDDERLEISDDNEDELQDLYDQLYEGKKYYSEEAKYSTLPSTSQKQCSSEPAGWNRCSYEPSIGNSNPNADERLTHKFENGKPETDRVENIPFPMSVTKLKLLEEIDHELYKYFKSLAYNQSTQAQEEWELYKRYEKMQKYGNEL